MTTLKQNIRLSQLDGLRGLFALMVALYHLPFEGDFMNIALLSNFMVRQGDLFVDFFFVLSGFVISLNYNDRLKNESMFRQYLSQRFLRLYPLLFYSVIVYLGFELAFNIFMPQLLANPEPISSLLWQTANSLLFLNATPIIDMPGMNFPSWSISSEMISYIIFGLLVLYSGRKIKYAAAIVLAVSALFLLAIGSYMETYKWGFLRGLLCFLTGYFTYVIFMRRSKTKIPVVFEYILPVLLVLILYIRYHIVMMNEVFTLSVIPLLFGLSVLVFGLSDGAIVRLMHSKPLQFLGKISYSIYLNHAIVMVLTTKLAFSFLKFPVTDLNVTLVVVLYLAVLIVYSYLTYTYVEIKCRKYLQEKFLNK